MIIIYLEFFKFYLQLISIFAYYTIISLKIKYKFKILNIMTDFLISMLYIIQTFCNISKSLFLEFFIMI